MDQKSTLVPLIVAALVGGIAGGAAGRLSAPSAKDKPAASAAPEPGDSSELAKKLENLERTVATLERERRVTRAALAARGAGDDDPPAADGGARRPGIDDPLFEAAVRDMMDQVEDEKREERRARMAERRKEAADRWAGWLSGELGLSDAQKNKVAEVVKSYFAELQAMRLPVAGPTSRDDWRQKARELRAKSEKELGQVLDAAQMKKYEGLEDDQKIGFGMGRGGRRGGGGGLGGP